MCLDAFPNSLKLNDEKGRSSWMSDLKFVYICLRLSLSEAFSKGSAVTFPFFTNLRQLQDNFLLCEILFRADRA